MGKTNLKPRGQRFRRALMLPRRYGLTSKRFLRNLKDMVALLKRRGVVATFPMTVTVLERHLELANMLNGMDMAVHGFRHRDISHLDTASQASIMKVATERFRSFGLEATGFRAPYLRWSESTIEAAAATGFLYDSSMPAGWSCGTELDSRTDVKIALAAYGIEAISTHSPSLRGKLIEMPVALPDDEILIDRLGVTEFEGLSRAMTAMADSAILSSGHLVLQLHPERFHFFGEALDNMLDHAFSKRAWVAPLRDVAKWWLKRTPDGPRWPDSASCALTISGDIDAVTLGDFVVRRLGR